LIGETALIAPVPQAEPHVADLRLRFDSRAAEGVPAHITVLHPFGPHPVPAAVLNELNRVFGRFDPFDFRLREVARWPENLHLVPTPSDPFVALTKAIWAAFPAYPPYEGRFPEIVPHLSVAQGRTVLLDEAETLLRRAVPPTGISAACTEVTLITNIGTAWEEICRFRLGESRASRA